MIRTLCPECGAIRVDHRAVAVRISGSGSATCLVSCPHCGCEVVKTANDSLVAVLRAVGAHIVDERAEPVITEADIAEFKLRLAVEADPLRFLGVR